MASFTAVSGSGFSFRRRGRFGHERLGRGHAEGRQERAARVGDFESVDPVREPVGRVLAGRPNVYLLEPLGYREFIDVFRRCTLVLTDSGGVQEEAPTLNKPVLVMRDTTERPEGVTVGAVKLVGASFAGIFDGVSELLTDDTAYRQMTNRPNPYGDGTASAQIVAACAKFLEGSGPA